MKWSLVIRVYNERMCVFKTVIIMIREERIFNNETENVTRQDVESGFAVSFYRLVLIEGSSMHHNCFYLNSERNA